jgi:YQGE family putative transporter
VTKLANDYTKNSTKDFSKQNQVGILGVHATYFAIDLFVSIFLIARILTTFDGDFSRVALFNCTVWCGIMLMFWLFSYVVKKFSRVWCIRISTVGLLAGVILVLLLRDSLADYYLLLGAVWGLSLGIYWCSMLTFTSETQGGKRMSGYVSWFIGISAFTRIVFPFTLGAIIESPNLGFGSAAGIATGLAVILLLFTLILRDQKKSEGKNFSMRAFFRYIREKKIKKPIWSQFWIQIVYGFVAVISLCVTIIVVLNVESNLELGILTSIWAGASILVLLIYKAIKSPKAKTWAYFILGSLPLLGAIGLLFDVNLVLVVICQGAYLSFKPAVQSELEKARTNLMADFGAEHLHTESLLFTEFAYFASRFAGVGLILAVYFSGVFYLFQVLIVLLMATFFISIILLHFWNKKHLRVQSDNIIECLATDN